MKDEGGRMKAEGHWLTRLRPFSLARYNASSAARITFAGKFRYSLGSATPMLTVTERVWSGFRNARMSDSGRGFFGAPVVGAEFAGSRSSVYRFHLDSPIPFTKSIRATIEHGHANHRSDDYSSVAYWYQTEPHAPFPTLPTVEQRLPRLHPVGGPGNSIK